jgi:hypothetical protein
METASQARRRCCHLFATIHRRFATIPPRLPQLQALKYRCRQSAAAERKETMQFEKRPSALCARTVAVEMTNLVIYGVLTGTAVAIVMAVPVVLLSAAA